MWNRDVGRVARAPGLVSHDHPTVSR
jgi:hypothetical protein